MPFVDFIRLMTTRGLLAEKNNDQSFASFDQETKTDELTRTPDSIPTLLSQSGH